MPDEGAGPRDDDVVPDALRSALVRWAADVLGGLDAGQTPASLQAVRRFAPRRRAAAGAVPLWAALREDDAFRARVARVWVEAHGSDDDADGAPPGVDAAVGAWLQGRPWRPLLPDEPEPASPPDHVPGRAAALEREVARLRAALGVARDGERAARDDLASLQRELRRLRSDADRARSEARAALATASQDASRAADDRAAAERERTQAAADLRAAAAERRAARDEARRGQQLAEARVRLLLDTVVDAAAGLRAELALPPVHALPADIVGDDGQPAGARPTSRGRTVDDPALLDELLRLPRAHLLVDGYNVSKTGWSHVPLADQRRMLVDGLAALAAQTGAEVTCAFDGVAGGRAAGHVRGVRVLFTAGETADDLLRRLVAAEPRGRVLVVVTSDQEVVGDVEDAGAWAVPSATLVERLRRR